MRFIAVMLLMLAACTSTEAPSCETAVTHYYATSGCHFTDANGNVLTESNVGIACQQQAAQESSNCNGLLDDWLSCLNDLAPNAGAQCSSCSSEQMAVIECH